MTRNTFFAKIVWKSQLTNGRLQPPMASSSKRYDDYKHICTKQRSPHIYEVSVRGIKRNLEINISKMIFGEVN